MEVKFCGGKRQQRSFLTGNPVVSAAVKSSGSHLFQIFFQRPGILFDDFRMGQAYIAQMPGFKGNACAFCFQKWIADDKSVIPAVAVYVLACL